MSGSIVVLILLLLVIVVAFINKDKLIALYKDKLNPTNPTPKPIADTVITPVVLPVKNVPIPIVPVIIKVPVSQPVPQPVLVPKPISTPVSKPVPIIPKKICPDGTSISDNTCVYDRGIGIVPGCATGKVQKGIECYEPPQQGYDWTTSGGLLIGKICPTNTNDSGTTCWYDRGVGLIPSCAAGKVQKGIECYELPQQGYDWTTPGGLLVGKVCPTNTNDSGTTCWYDRGVGTSLQCAAGKVQKGIECYEPPQQGYDWTTPGGLLVGKVCPPGTNDSGTTCWYDRGVGRIPNKRDCTNGQRDDGTSCWQDSYGRGGGRIPDYEACKDDYNTFPLTCTRKGCGGYHGIFGWWFPDCTNNDRGGHGIDTYNRASRCHDDEEQNGGFCYPKCKSGYHAVGCCVCAPDGHDGGYITTTLGARQYCNDNEEMIGGLCYTKPRDGYTCNLTNCYFGKDVKWGNKTGLIDTCYNDRVSQDGMCYIKPQSGYTCNATHCQFGKDVKPGNKTGLIDACATDRQLQDGMCYIKPQNGYTCNATHCQFGKDVKPGNKVGLIDQCTNDRELQNALCYTKAKSGFKCDATSCTT